MKKKYEIIVIRSEPTSEDVKIIIMNIQNISNLLFFEYQKDNIRKIIDCHALAIRLFDLVISE